jgi:hypothetical protein
MARCRPHQYQPKTTKLTTHELEHSLGACQ